MRKKLNNIFIKDEMGQGLVEYSLIIVLVAIALVFAVGLMGSSVRDFFDDTSLLIRSL